jgi:large subunit ribosomal protein L19
MTHSVILQNSTKLVKNRPELRPGFTVRVHEKIQEGGKERVQIFEGLIISMHKGATPMDSTITVRKVVSGIGTEKLFPVHSPSIDKIEVKKVAKVRRAKLFFLRGRTGKSARLSERFTTSDEFADATTAEVKEEVAAEVQEEVASKVDEVAEEVAEAKEDAAA